MDALAKLSVDLFGERQPLRRGGHAAGVGLADAVVPRAAGQRPCSIAGIVRSMILRSSQTRPAVDVGEVELDPAVEVLFPSRGRPATAR